MEFKATYVSWNDIERWSEGMLNMLISDNYKPDIVIGIARGGLIPARMMSDYLFIKDLLTVKTEHWGLTASMDGKAVLKGKLNYDIGNKKVLIVDDITDTGESIKLAYDYIKTLNPAEVKTSSMLYVNSSSYVPDYYGEGISREKWAWFIFPWNVYEDTYNLSKKFMDKPLKIDELKELLKSNYGLNVDDTNFKKVMNNISKLNLIKNNDDIYELI